MLLCCQPQIKICQPHGGALDAGEVELTSASGVLLQKEACHGWEGGWEGGGQGRIETTGDGSSDPATCGKLRQGHWSHSAHSSLKPRGIPPRQTHCSVLPVWIAPSLFLNRGTVWVCLLWWPVLISVCLAGVQKDRLVFMRMFEVKQPHCRFRHNAAWEFNASSMLNFNVKT